MDFIKRKVGEPIKNYQTSSQFYQGLKQQTGGQLSTAKTMVKKLLNPNQIYEYKHNMVLAQTEHEKVAYEAQNFRTEQPQIYEPKYVGKQQQEKILANRLINPNDPNKSQLKQYYKGRTDVTAIRGNVNVKEEDFDQDLEDCLQYGFPDPFIRYKIIPADQYKMALDVTTVDEQNLTKGNIIVWDYHGGPNQHFYLKKAQGANEYFIINASTGFVLQVPDASRENDVQVHMTPRFNTPNEIWRLQPCGKDLFIIRSFCGKVLDVKHHWMRNGVPVIQYEENGGANQKWRIWPS